MASLSPLHSALAWLPFLITSWSCSIAKALGDLEITSRASHESRHFCMCAQTVQSPPLRPSWRDTLSSALITHMAPVEPGPQVGRLTALVRRKSWLLASPESGVHQFRPGASRRCSAPSPEH